MSTTPHPNQPPPYEGSNLYTGDPVLKEAIAREAAAWAEPALVAWGQRMGSAEVLALADAANRFGPQLRAFDRTGERIDSVEFHPAWHVIMELATAVGEHAAPWRDAREGAQVARAAMVFLHAQVENGSQCPLTMTFASVPALVAFGSEVPGMAEHWLPKITALDYDPRALPIAAKRAALVGMGMTERQGGSDVRSNRTRAVATADGSYRIHGDKWFFSAPQCDAHLVLAQAEGGLSCFFVPQILEGGQRNAITLLRLKDKLGNRSNASSEVQFAGATGFRIGEEGRGIASILTMVQHTRLDCVIASAGMIRAAFAWALHHASHRVAFGRRLIEQPLMTSVLADLALESEAATALAMRIARAFEARRGTSDAALARVLTPAAKYWVCKRAAAIGAEAMEVHGGNGYVEENPLPRIYREMPVNAIWEGSGNVIALDVQRALARDAETREALAQELNAARGVDARFDLFASQLGEWIDRNADDPASARRLAQAIATGVQASVLLRHAPHPVADAFVASRLAESSFGGALFGTLPAGIDASAIVKRALDA